MVLVIEDNANSYTTLYKGPQCYLKQCKEKERIRLLMPRCIRMIIGLMITGTDIETMKEVTMIEAMTTSR